MEFSFDHIKRTSNKLENMTNIYNYFDEYLYNTELYYLNAGMSPYSTLTDPADFFKYNETLYLYMLDGLNATNKSILDVSCFKGAGPAIYKKHNPTAEVYGVDFIPGFIDAARNKYKDIKFDVMEASNLKFEDNSFDIVTNLDSSFPYPNLEGFYKEVVRILKPNGVFSYADGFTNESRFLDHSHLFQQIDRYDITKNILEACVRMNEDLDKYDLSDQVKAYYRYANNDNFQAYSSVKFIKFVCYV